MARVTVEDCVVKVPNRFELVLLAAQRAREITSGAPLSIDRDDDKNPVVALREIADETVALDHLKSSVVRGMQKHVEIDEPEESHELELDTALFGVGAPAGALMDAELDTEVDADAEEPRTPRMRRRKTRTRRFSRQKLPPTLRSSTRTMNSPKTCWKSRKRSISPIPPSPTRRVISTRSSDRGQCAEPGERRPE